MRQAMLTTSDNPYDPFNQYTEWLAFDESQGYYTNEYLARIALLSESLSKAEQETAMETAIDEIVALNPLGVHIKVFRSKTDILSHSELDSELSMT